MFIANKSLAKVIFLNYLLTIIRKMQDFMFRLLENLFTSLPICSLHTPLMLQS